MKLQLLTKQTKGYIYDGTEDMAAKLSNLKGSPFTLDGGGLYWETEDENIEIIKGDAIIKVGKAWMVEKGWKVRK